MDGTTTLVIASVMGVAIGIISLTLIYIIYRRITKANRRKNKGKYKNLENPSDSEPIRKSIPDWDTSSFNEGSFTQELELAQQEEESPSFSQDEKETDQIEGVMFVCIKESFPTKKDELKIRVGDTLQMQMMFSDGLCLGTNMNTGLKGMYR
ncbi:hypothetical protein BC833DRAFT_349486 [Globomyces pollinis-pini]|nr:hypothetical protein BC833DRAFT_349486 [Globomyces pollinis-pini]